MNLLDLLPGLKKAATTGGGEWAGPCPFCEGNDRFRVWPEQGPTGRYWCRGCGKKGDGIQFLRDKDGLSYREACVRLGVMPSLTGKCPHRVPTRATWATWEPRPSTAPGDVWTDRAGAFLKACQRTLLGPAGSGCREWLKGRGLTEATIKAGGLGWHIADTWESRESWGLLPEQKEDGKPRRVWLPGGLVIPLKVGDQVHRLRVRRPDPGEGPRYVIIPGSGSSPLTLGTGTAWVIVESELDAFLLWQEAGDLAGVIALGSAQARPDLNTDRALRAAGLILVSLDSDGAGASESWKWWLKQYPNARRWPIPAGYGKDPTEALQAGLDLRAWVMAGLPEEVAKETNDSIATEPEPAKSKPPNGGNETREPTTEPIQSAPPIRLGPLQSTQTEKTYIDQESERRTEFKPFPDGWIARFSEEQLERLAIMTVCGGLSDLEAFTEAISQC